MLFTALEGKGPVDHCFGGKGTCCSLLWGERDLLFTALEGKGPVDHCFALGPCLLYMYREVTWLDCQPFLAGINISTYFHFSACLFISVITFLACVNYDGQLVIFILCD